MRNSGTRFRLFAQSPELSSVGEPETIWLTPPAGSIGPGPSDERMYVVDPLSTKEPYEYPALPPFPGAIHSPVLPSRDGHFDHLPVASREFRAAHMYGMLRFVLDIWEDYFGHPIPWHFRRDFERLELIPSLEWDNAHSGYGFIEAGAEVTERGAAHHYALNFDVLAHELGHSILYSQVGTPTLDGLTSEYLGFHEACSDVVALVSALHFDSVVDRLLDSTRGNLYTLNELNRIAETSDAEQIRLASNDLKMSDVIDAWSALPQSCDEHRLGQPVTGAIFDVLVDVFLSELAGRGVVPSWLADASRIAPNQSLDYGHIQREFDTAYQGEARAFKSALLQARDFLGQCLALAWGRLDPVIVSFSQLYRELLAAELVVSGGRRQDSIRESFEWREIALDHTLPSTDSGRETRTRSWPRSMPSPVPSTRRAPYIERVRRAVRDE